MEKVLTINLTDLDRDMSVLEDFVKYIKDHPEDIKRYARNVMKQTNDKITQIIVYILMRSAKNNYVPMCELFAEYGAWTSKILSIAMASGSLDVLKMYNSKLGLIPGIHSTAELTIASRYSDIIEWVRDNFLNVMNIPQDVANYAFAKGYYKTTRVLDVKAIYPDFGAAHILIDELLKLKNSDTKFIDFSIRRLTELKDIYDVDPDLSDINNILADDRYFDKIAEWLIQFPDILIDTAEYLIENSPNLYKKLKNKYKDNDFVKSFYAFKLSVDVMEEFQEFEEIEDASEE